MLEKIIEECLDVDGQKLSETENKLNKIEKDGDLFDTSLSGDSNRDILNKCKEQKRKLMLSSERVMQRLYFCLQSFWSVEYTP